MVRTPSPYRCSDRASWRLACLTLLALGGVLLTGGCSGGDPMAPPPASDSAPQPAGAAARQIVDAGGARVPVDCVPKLAVVEPHIARWLAEGLDGYHHVYIMSGQPLQFSWRAVGGTPLSQAATYRHGWDLQDPDDPDDPGWVGSPGSGLACHSTGEVVFWSGLHELTIERRDGVRLLVRVTIGLSAEPVLPQP